MTYKRYARGCDISRWQDKIDTPQGIDFEKMVSTGMKFVFIRCLNGLTYDRDFAKNWAGAKAVGLKRGAYIFFQAGMSFSDQANKFMAAMGPDLGELPLVIDFERGGVNGVTPSRAMEVSREFVNLIEARLKTLGAIHLKVMIYTNPDIIKNYLGDKLPQWMLDRSLWIAHYIVQKTGEVTKPNIGSQYTDWLFWQTTDRGDGKLYGVESEQLDMDLANMTEEELDVYCKIKPDIQEKKTIEERVLNIEVWLGKEGYIK